MSEKKKTIVKEEVYVALNFSFSREIVEKKITRRDLLYLYTG